MNKWLYINFSIKIATIIWAIFFIIYPFFRFDLLMSSPFLSGVIGFSVILTTLALGLLILLYWNWSEIPVWFYLILVTWLRHMKTIEMGGIPLDTGKLASSIFILFLISGIIAWQNS